MNNWNELKEACFHLLFPHICEGCGRELSGTDSCLCLKCIASLPRTNFEFLPGNPVEKRFYGRLPLQHASGHFYFSKSSLVAHLVHQLKYKSNKELGIQLGQWMGESLRLAGRFNADAMIPLPLFANKERKRGYNQSMLLCEGISNYLKIPVIPQIIQRPLHTDTQTNKGRIERWQNIEGKFALQDPGPIAGRHILLVDDVITTGATIESCGTEILKAPGASLSVACLCHAFS